MSELTTRTWTGRDSGHAAGGLAGLHVWLTDNGYALSTTVADGQRVVLASTGPDPHAAGAPVGARCKAPGTAGLTAVVPPGFGLLVDGGTPDRRQVAASVMDGLRARQTPRGDEPDLRAFAVPPHLRHVRDAAIAAAKQAGAKGGIGVWASGGGCEGLWISLRGPTAESVDAAYEAVASRAPAEPVTVLDQGGLSRDAQDRVLRGLAKESRGEEGTAFTSRQNAVVVVVCVLGAVLIVLGRDQAGRTGTALQVVGWALEVLLVLGVVVVASGRGFAVPGLPRPGSGDKVRLLPLLGLLTVSGLLLWQAVRGLS